MGKDVLFHSALSQDRADVYFSHAQKILKAEGIDADVTMEIFPSRVGLLCGIEEVLDILAEVLPEGSNIWSLNQGEMMESKEIVLRITAPYSAFGIYETALLGILASESGWATAARDCVEAAAGIPIISFGARHVHPDISHRLEYAAIVGGCSGCATPAGSALAGRKAQGTIPHAVILIFGDTLKALKAFDRHMPMEIRRIALVDTFKDEAEESIRVADALGERLWGVRLDTPAERGGVTPDLVKEVRVRLDRAGHGQVKIVVSGGLDVERIRQFVESDAPVDSFGVGSAISGPNPIDFTGDIKEVNGKPIAKRGRIPGITHNPRLEKIDLTNRQV